EAQTNEGSGRCVGKPEVIAKKRCPKSLATSIGLRSRTLATIAERISHSHPALTVAGATRIEYHLEPVAIVTPLIFSVPLCLLTWLLLYRIDLPSSVGLPFSAPFFWAL